MRAALILRGAAILRAILILSIAALAAGSGYGRKTTLRLSAKDADEEPAMARGSFMVASHCPDCNNGYRINQIAFSGFDKHGSSSSESFFITNNTDRTMSGVSLYIEYLTPDGRQLHKRFLKLDCNIPAGETRKADVKSWDTQRSFHYERSRASKSSSPFTVVFDPVAYYLRF